MFVQYTFQTICLNLILCTIKTKEEKNEIIILYTDPLLTRTFLKHVRSEEREREREREKERVRERFS